MIVSNVHINSFRSIRELSFPLDPKITVLIGPNESGKTNILKAFLAFRNDMPLTLEQTCQYSEHYQLGKPPEIGLEFNTLTKDEKTKLGGLYEGFRDIESFTLVREGPKVSDYKIQTGDKVFSLGNGKPLFDLLPNILYFDTIPIIKDHVTMEALVKNDEDARTESNLLKIGGVEEPSVIFEDTTRGRRATEETGREITRRIQQVWTQEPSLEIKLRVNGKILYIDFSDSTTVYDTPKFRSPGFLWFISFYINFIATTSDARANEFLFMLDEPGSHLHPSGQKDLANLLENLSQKNQVIYTTHSPFMINRSSPQRVRVVNKDINGTSIDSVAYRENWKPLRQSIGLTVGDLFFFSNKGSVKEFPEQKNLLFSRNNKKNNII
jgi:predicted ATPase